MNLCLKGTTTFCAGCFRHFQLRGRSSQHKKSWTLVAQPYPDGVYRTLAVAVAIGAGLRKQGSFDGSSFARIEHRRIGKAKNPGPPYARCEPLDAVPLLGAKTLQLQTKVWRWFLDWASSSISSEAVESLTQEPATLGYLLHSFGNYLYTTGKS